MERTLTPGSCQSGNGAHLAFDSALNDRLFTRLCSFGYLNARNCRVHARSAGLNLSPQIRVGFDGIGIEFYLDSELIALKNGSANNFELTKITQLDSIKVSLSKAQILAELQGNLKG